MPNKYQLYKYLNELPENKQSYTLEKLDWNIENHVLDKIDEDYYIPLKLKDSLNTIDVKVTLKELMTLSNIFPNITNEDIRNKALEKIEIDANLLSRYPTGNGKLYKKSLTEQLDIFLNEIKNRENNKELQIKQEKINYHIDNNSLGEGKPKEKVRRNIDAIKLLKKLEDENRFANKEEQGVLAEYVGWGGLPDVFDENKSNWYVEYQELKDILTDEEYKSARSSILTAFYTPPIVIRAIYTALKNMGVEQANILEPSCGIGNFLGMLPEEMQNSKLYGIELDSISGRIAKQLYQNADIRVEGYEKEVFTDVYNELKKKLVQKGITPDEIAFIHEADTEAKKKELFSKVRQGKVRILMGSTKKLGAGTNIQDKLIATHHLDCAWKPDDLTQRNGRMVRQGNENKKVYIYSYVTEKTFDSYMYQLVEQKQKFISQIMTSKTPARTMEDIDEKALTYGEIKALATGNPLILEKTTLDTEVSKLKLLKQEFMNQKYALQDKVIKYFPEEIARLNNKIGAMEEDTIWLESYTKPNKDGFSPMRLEDVLYTEKQYAGKKLLECVQGLKSMKVKEIGEYRGFKMEISFDSISRNIKLKLKNKFSYSLDLGTDINSTNVIDKDFYKNEAEEWHKFAREVKKKYL